MCDESEREWARNPLIIIFIGQGDDKFEPGLLGLCGALLASLNPTGDRYRAGTRRTILTGGAFFAPAVTHEHAARYLCLPSRR